MSKDGRATMRAGGFFSGRAEGCFLYPYMFSEPWPYPDIPKPDKRYFDGRHFLLLQRVSYHPAARTVPHAAHPGLISDGGTIRTAVGWVVLSTPFRDFLLAYLIHDQICKDAADLALINRQEGRALRLFGDRLFYLMVVDLGANRWQARSAYKAVRVGARLSGLG